MTDSLNGFFISILAGLLVIGVIAGALSWVSSKDKIVRT